MIQELEINLFLGRLKHPYEIVRGPQIRPELAVDNLPMISLQRDVIEPALRAVESDSPGAMLVYHFSPKECDTSFRELLTAMAKKGLQHKAHKVAVFHANLTPAHRDEILAAIKAGIVTVVFGTVCLGLVRFQVVKRFNFDLLLLLLFVSLSIIELFRFKF